MLPRVRAIEECALAAWPAAESVPFDGWVLRAMAGVSRRANSVWTGCATGPRAIHERIDHAERFYTVRSLPAVFQLASFAQPRGLDLALAERGYAIEAPVSVQVARAAEVARGLGAVEVVVERTLSDAWFQVSGASGRFAAVEPVYRGLLQRLSGRALFALARCEGVPAAVALGVEGAGWLGISSMLTLPDHRRRGAARAVLAPLAEQARRSSIDELYLQVEQDNRPALALYRSVGFAEHHRYHYRTQPR